MSTFFLRQTDRVSLKERYVTRWSGAIGLRTHGTGVIRLYQACHCLIKGVEAAPALDLVLIWC
jgi:hypothetical protein